MQHVFLVAIISCYDKLWGLPRRVLTLFEYQPHMSHLQSGQKRVLVRATSVFPLPVILMKWFWIHILCNNNASDHHVIATPVPTQRITLFSCESQWRASLWAGRSLDGKPTWETLRLSQISSMMGDSGNYLPSEDLANTKILQEPRDDEVQEMTIWWYSIL